ncbi:uncharacterized protein LOC120079216 [Benincasa hispida]|uniref:uncharacterized protein LOC120079216 n=1 Tax=Benincasa hispida TaxID=102211 RepID=UPI00190087F8|nr:uncharacterized protein LOC120079216 [Benincasa hispida]
MKRCFRIRRLNLLSRNPNRHIAGELKSRPQGALLSLTKLPRNSGNTRKEQCQVVTLRSGKTVAEEKKEPRRTTLVAMELQTPLTQEEPKENEMMKPEVASTSKPMVQGTMKVQLPPFSQRLEKKKNDEVQYHRFMDMLKQLHINIHFTKAIEQMLKYAKFFKDMVKKKRSTGKFAMLNVRQLAPTTVTLQLADRALVHLEGKVKDVLVSIEKFILPADSIILDYKADKDVPIIFGRSVLSIGRAQIDVYKGEITLSMNGKKLRIVLGHVVSERGIEVDKAKIDVIANLPYLTFVREIRSFLGSTGFYRSFIKDF